MMYIIFYFGLRFSLDYFAISLSFSDYLVVMPVINCLCNFFYILDDGQQSLNSFSLGVNNILLSLKLFVEIPNYYVFLSQLF